MSGHFMLIQLLFLLTLLQIKHCYADFCIQTYPQTVRKGIYRDLVGVSHSVDHVWTTLVALLIYNVFYTTNAIDILIVALFEGIVHYHIDWYKVKVGSKDNTKPIFWRQFGLDQLAHQFTYIIMIWYIIANPLR